MPSLLETISSFSISDMEIDDSLAWKNVENGKLTIKIAYEMLANANNSGKWKSFPWDIDSAPSHSMVTWRLMHNKIPTDENMTLRGFSFPSKCSLCDSNEEKSTHLFFDCFFAVKIWSWFSSILEVPNAIKSLADCLQILNEAWSQQAMAVIKSSIVFIIYQIWKARNMARFEDKLMPWQRCISNVAARAKLVGKLTAKNGDNSINNFSFLKKFDIAIHPRKLKVAVEVLWCPPIAGWIKCNIDGAAAGSPLLAANGGIFRDAQAKHVISSFSWVLVLQ
ncbi:uncharacterized protein LOC131614340 [Vicia villosa]|uniref:uncharacterized protein LOC131614340 n=1 Tax=Vicia villosa TaxID=3911 RepID=UPI00273CED30|nr:uncharacterized protein LOC131614340 [Vicia villosa]